MIDYEYYYDQYRRMPRSSIANQKDLLDFNSTASNSTYSFWPGTKNRPLSTTYIDGSTLLGSEKRPSSMKDSFPKGKGRRKPTIPSEKKTNTGDIYMSLVPTEKIMTDSVIARSERNRSPLSMTTGTQWSTLPDVQRRSADIRNSRLYSATIFDDESSSDTRFYGRPATTHANGGWVRRYKSISESQILTSFLRDRNVQEKILSRKRTHQQLFHLTSPSKSSFTSSSIRNRLALC